jgi:ribosomal protein S18 acetylase RimI-like enzyme
MTAWTARRVSRRLVGAVGQRGVRGVFRRTVDALRSRLWDNGAHLWLELVLPPSVPWPQLPTDLELVAGTENCLPALAALPTLSTWAARRRLERGEQLWLVRDGAGEIAFACWLLTGETPAFGGRGGVVAVPTWAISLEDSVTSPHYRGRSIAAAAWSLLAQRVADDGYVSIITTVEQTNIAVQRALAKSGFTELCAVQAKRRPWGTSVRTTVLATKNEQARARAQELAKALAR